MTELVTTLLDVLAVVLFAAGIVALAVAVLPTGVGLGVGRSGPGDGAVAAVLRHLGDVGGGAGLPAGVHDRP